MAQVEAGEQHEVQMVDVTLDVPIGAVLHVTKPARAGVFKVNVESVPEGKPAPATINIVKSVDPRQTIIIEIPDGQSYEVRHTGVAD